MELDDDTTGFQLHTMENELKTKDTLIFCLEQTVSALNCKIKELIDDRDYYSSMLSELNKNRCVMVRKVSKLKKLAGNNSKPSDSNDK